MLSIQNNYNNVSFQAHMPRKFSSMMEQIHQKAFKNFGDTFQHTDAIKLETSLENGKKLSGTANFLDGKFHSLVMDEGMEGDKKLFMQTALNKYNQNLNKKLNKRIYY